MTEGLLLARVMAFIRNEEDLRLEPYRDIAGNLTVGYGHRCGEDQGPVTMAEADCLLYADVAPVLELVKRIPGLSENQRVALVSFVFNVGRGAFEQSTMKKKLMAGDMAGAAAEFGRWCYVRYGSGMVTSKGLVARRWREKELFVLGMSNG